VFNEYSAENVTRQLATLLNYVKNNNNQQDKI
jgi:hypothetical protein